MFSGPIQSRAKEDSEDGRKNEMCKEPALTNDAVVVGRRHVGDGDRHEARAEVEVGDQGLEDWRVDVSVRRPSRRWKDRHSRTSFLSTTLAPLLMTGGASEVFLK